MIAVFARHICIVAIVALGLIAPAAAHDERLRLIDTQEYKHVTEVPHVDRGRVIFAHYSEDGNNQNVIAIDPADGSVQTLVAGVRDPRFIAADDRYLVYAGARAGVTAPLIVADRDTGKRLASVRLRDRVVWGHIDGDRLILVQRVTSGYERTPTSLALIYRLPTLQLERKATVTGAHEVQFWNDKIVVLGKQLAVHDLDLNKLAAADFPPPDPRQRSGCQAHSLRVYADSAIIGSSCGQIAVYTLPAAQLLRVIPGFATFHSFDVIDGLLFVADQDDSSEAIRVYDLSTTKELARLSVEAQFLAARAGHLLSMQRSNFATPGRFTLYSPDLEAIRSDTARDRRVGVACAKAASSGDESRDVYRAIEECEAAGIGSYLDVAAPSADLAVALSNYAEWLARSLSRYGEAKPLLERFARGARQVALLALVRRKADYLGSSSASHMTMSSRTPGVRKQGLNFGSFANLIKFADSRAYVARYDCGPSGTPGVTLDVLDRASFSMIKRVVIANCDDDYQDNISSIHLISGYLVLGLEYRYDEQRPNVAVVDANSITLVARGSIAVQPVSLGEWQGRLLRCATVPGEPHTRFEPATARLVPATEAEAIACLNRDVVAGRATGFVADGRERGLPILTTPNYKVFPGYKTGLLTSYRFTRLDDRPAETRTSELRNPQILAIPDRDAVVLSHPVRQEQRFSRFDIPTQTETILFQIISGAGWINATWRNFLFVAIGHDLLVYDFERNLVARYEKNLISEGVEPICPSCNDRNDIRQLLIDNDRLIVLTLDGANSRVIDLPVYVANFKGKDFFEAAVSLDGS